MKINLTHFEKFETRHNGADENGIRHMLDTIGADSLDALIAQTIPDSIRLKKDLELPAAQSEYMFLHEFKQLAKQNKLFRSYVGQGYYNTIVPSVILRNVLENPGWYTAYTPYQAEIAQGRLEALVNFQTMVMDLTGMEIANASLLDEGTAAAEAMAMLSGLRKGAKKKANKFFVDKNTFLQTLDILKTRALPIGIELVVGEIDALDLQDEELYGVLLQYPNKWGAVKDYARFIAEAKEQNVFVAVAADLLSLTLLTPPGEMGADVVVGTSQRLGVPMGYGGPHAAYFACKEEYKRQIPGRIIGVSKDRTGKNAYRMALQTREQHIRREKATSNICTAQVLLAVMAGMYGVYHGPQGLKRIAGRVHLLTQKAAVAIQGLGFKQLNEAYFDTLAVQMDSAEKVEALRKAALEKEINFNYRPETTVVTLSLDETTTLQDVQDIVAAFAKVAGKEAPKVEGSEAAELKLNVPESLIRRSALYGAPGI